MSKNQSFDLWLDLSLTYLSTLISVVQDAGLFSISEGNRLYSDFFYLLKVYRGYQHGLHKSDSY